MKTYQIEFKGRPIKSHGVFVEQFQVVYAENEAGALRALAEHFERVPPPPELREVPNPFTAEGLLLGMQNDKGTNAYIAALVENIVNAARRYRAKLGAANAAYYDDLEGEQYCAYHDKPENQYPDALLLEAVAEAILYQLNETQGGVALGISDRLTLGGAK